MEETRDPKLGTWVLFEGDQRRANKAPHWFWDSVPEEDVNEPITWPITLRLIRLAENGVFEGRDVVVHEDFTVEVGEHEKVSRDELDDERGEVV